eukprot:6112472-Alexandrium_andersonii.AAC.1
MPQMPQLTPPHQNPHGHSPPITNMQPQMLERYATAHDTDARHALSEFPDSHAGATASAPPALDAATVGTASLGLHARRPGPQFAS